MGGLGEAFQIGAGAERASGTLKDRDESRRILVEGAKCLCERCGRVAIDSIAPLRAIDGHDADRAFVLDQNGMRHGCDTSLAVWRMIAR